MFSFPPSRLWAPLLLPTDSTLMISLLSTVSLTSPVCQILTSYVLSVSGTQHRITAFPARAREMPSDRSFQFICLLPSYLIYLCCREQLSLMEILFYLSFPRQPLQTPLCSIYTYMFTSKLDYLRIKKNCFQDTPTIQNCLYFNYRRKPVWH